jgi:hypothetical protein
MHFVTVDQLAQMRTQLIIGVCTDVVELINGDQTVIEQFDPKPVHGKAEGGMGANQYAVITLQETTHSADLAVIPT